MNVVADAKGRKEPAMLCTDLLQLLDGYREAALENPQDNPIARLANELSGRIASGKYALDRIDKLVDNLLVQSFEYRANRLSRYVGGTSEAINGQRVRELIYALARDAEGGRVPFAEFRSRIEQEVFGIVVTAHPTFGMSRGLTAQLGALACRPEPVLPGTSMPPAVETALLAEDLAVAVRCL